MMAGFLGSAIESPAIALGKLLLSKGFYPASCIGVAEPPLTEACAVGVLRGIPNSLEWRVPRIFLGVVWLDNRLRGADSCHWVFEVYYREHLDLARELASDMPPVFKVNVAVHLVGLGTQMRFEPLPCSLDASW